MKVTHSHIFATMFMAMLGVSAAQVTEEEGVRCPSDSVLVVGSDDNPRAILCQKTVYVESACLPTMQREFAGVDRCVPQVTGNPTASGPLFNGGQYQNVTRWVREVSANGPDRFRGIDHVFPEGAIIVGDPVSGVVCPSGFRTQMRTNNPRAFYCEDKSPAVRAKCEWGYFHEEDQEGERDLCRGTVPGSGNRPTIPTNVVNREVFLVEEARGDINWVLDRQRGKDSWTKVLYAYPQAVNRLVRTRPRVAEISG